MSKKVLVPVADGTEELEAVGIIDVLRRAEAEVTVASVGQLQITASRGVKLIADTLISDCVDTQYDLVVLPGGIPGADNLRDSKELTGILKRQSEKGLLYGAICASPAIILEHHGLLKGRKATCHPAYTDQLSNTEEIESRVVVDGSCITSQGAGTVIDFALTLVELLYGGERREAVAGSMAI
ncbi:MAG: DJ-1/PfpI family protein [Deltaproteobacteria bacterium]|nr:DJ-1/PfpI family protein [Deltaproteobacteria bacterium]